MSADNYTFKDFLNIGNGNPNTLTTLLKVPKGALYIDLNDGLTYRKTTSVNFGTGWEVVNGVAASKVVAERFIDWDTADQIATLTSTGLVRATTGNLLHHTYTPGGLILGTVALGTQTIAVATAATGLDISGDQTDNDGYEVFTHFAGASGRPFIVGSDRPFYFECELTIANVSGTDTFLVGFRRAEVNNGAFASYADYAALGIDTAAASATIKQLTGLNGTDVSTSTTDTLADATVYIVRIEVSAAGVVTFKHSQGAGSTPVAPTAGAAFTFDDGDPVIPFVHFLQATAADTGAVVIRRWEAGYIGANA